MILGYLLGGGRLHTKEGRRRVLGRLGAAAVGGAVVGGVAARYFSPIEVIKEVTETVIETEEETTTVEVPTTITKTVTEPYTPPPDKTPPLIEALTWKPTRVVNDKIYDIDVTAVVGNRSRSLSEVDISLIPVQYDHLPKQAFPEEETRVVKLWPRNLDIELFSVDFTDLKGGREYVIEAVARDVAKSSNKEKIKTPYLREFENFGRLLFDRGMIISAANMPGYMPWDMNIPMKGDDEPLLGRYDQVDDIVQWKHIDWATGHGINVFYIDGGFWEERKLRGREGKILSGLMDKGMKCAISWGWGAWEAIMKRGGVPGGPDWAVDLGNDENRQKFLNAISSVIIPEFFTHENYFSVNNKPVIFLYDSVALFNDREAIEGMRAMFKTKINKEPILIGDNILRIPSLPHDSDWYLKYKSFTSYDAATSWSGFHNRSEKRFVENYEEFYDIQMREWSRFSNARNVLFVPSVISGFDMSHPWAPNLPPIERSPKRFKERLEIATKYLDKKYKEIRIDTWNDFAEWSYIEPSTKDGFNFLITLKNFLTQSLN